MKRALLLALAPLALSALPAAAGCFPVHQFDGWSAPDARTIYIRVAQTRYFRLDLGAACQLLTAPGVHLINQRRGSDLVCSSVDWDLAVSRDTPGSLPSHCIVQHMSELTPAEVDAIPKQFRPH